MPSFLKRVKEGLTGSSNPQHPRAQSANGQSQYTNRASPAPGGASAQRAQPQYNSEQYQDDELLQQALEQSELEAALAASRIASNSDASPSGRPPRPAAAAEHAGPSDDEELKLALAVSEAEAKKAAKGKGVLRQSTSEKELQQALQESAQLAPKHQPPHAQTNHSRGGGSSSSQPQQDDTEDADLARALYESQQLAAASHTHNPAASHSVKSTAASPLSPSRSPRQQHPSAPMLASPAAAAHLQQEGFPIAHQAARQQPNHHSTSSSQHSASVSPDRHQHAQSGSQQQPLYPPIYQPGMPVQLSAGVSQQQHKSGPQSSSPQQPPHQYPSLSADDSHSPLYQDGHHGSGHLQSMLSADEIFARALQDELYAGSVTQQVPQAAPPSPPTNPNHLSSNLLQSSMTASSKLPNTGTPQRTAAPSTPIIPQHHPHAPNLQPAPNVCAACGKSLFPGVTYMVVGGVKYHANCFCCAACQLPIGINTQFSTGKEDCLPYHLLCFRKKFDPKCSVCQELIPAQDGVIRWNNNAFWKQKVCPRHMTDGTIKCCSCTRWQTQGEEWVTQLDGRMVCLDCLASIVRDTADAQPLYQQVLAFYQQLGMALPEVPPLMLVETSALNAAEDKEGRGSKGHTHGPVFHTRGLTLTAEYHAIQYVTTHRGKTYTQPMNLSDRDRYEVTAILVLYGFPWLLTGAILAHECMHAWLRLRGITQLPLQTEEGLCQLMGLLWLEAQDLSQQQGTWEERLASYFANQIRTDPSEVYGEGFKLALAAFQNYGLPAIISHVQQHGVFPI